MKKTIIAVLCVSALIPAIHVLAATPQLSIISPKGDVDWKAGTDVKITYSTTGLTGSLLSVGLAAADMHVFTGAHGEPLTQLILANSIPVDSDGVKTLNVTIPFYYDAGDYKLVIQTMPDFPRAAATSTGVIHLSSSIIKPSTGDTLRVGKFYTVKWGKPNKKGTDPGVPVNIFLVRNDESGSHISFTNVGTTTFAMNEFRFKVPADTVPGDSYQIFIAGPARVASAWSGVFSIEQK